VIKRNDARNGFGLLATFVDCEATSFNGYCTEIGFAQVWRGPPPVVNTATVERHPECDDLFIRSDSRLVRVEQWLDDYLKWDAAAEKITGISRALLLESGHPPHRVSAWLNDELAGSTSYSDARIFDSNWIDQVFRAAQAKRKFKIVQVERVTKRWDVDKRAFLDRCKGEYSVLHGDAKPHRAEADAVNWARIFINCWDHSLLERHLFAKIIGSLI